MHDLHRLELVAETLQAIMSYASQSRSLRPRSSRSAWRLYSGQRRTTEPPVPASLVASSIAVIPPVLGSGGRIRAALSDVLASSPAAGYRWPPGAGSPAAAANSHAMPGAPARIGPPAAAPPGRKAFTAAPAPVRIAKAAAQSHRLMCSSA